jgi:hypothetical protein
MPAAALGRSTRLRFRDPDGIGQTVGRDVIRADDPGSVDVRPQLCRLVGIDDSTGESPRLREVVAAMDLRQSLGGERQFEAADRVETPSSVELERCRFLDRIRGESLHRLRGIRLEDDPRGVTRGAAGLEQATLFDDGHIPPAPQSQLIGQRAADDACSDDRDAWSPAHGGGQDTRARTRWASPTADLYSGPTFALLATSAPEEG